VLATALLNDRLFATTEGLAGVLVYTASLQLARTITFSGLGVRLFGLATSAIDNYLYVSDFNGATVHRIDLSVTSTVSVVSWSVARNPVGLSMTSENNVLVATDSVSCAIEEYTPSGTRVRRITTNTSSVGIWQAVQVNHNVWAYTPDGDIVSQLCTAQTTGTLITCFGSTAGHGLTLSMGWPLGLAIDTRGYMLVADLNNNRILLVDPTMTSACPLQLPVNPVGPGSVSYDPSRGRLVVGEQRGQYRVLVFDGIWW